jgi:hypothetical protein
LGNIRLELEEQLNNKREKLATTESTLQDEVTKYKAISHKERFLRESVEERSK